MDLRIYSVFSQWVQRRSGERLKDGNGTRCAVAVIFVDEPREYRREWKCRAQQAWKRLG
jgi:hypothetical protein